MRWAYGLPHRLLPLVYGRLFPIMLIKRLSGKSLEADRRF